MKKYVEIIKIRRQTIKKCSPKYESEIANKVKNEIKLQVEQC